MRRVIFLVVVCFLLTACNVRNSGNIGNIFVKKVNNLDSYYLAGDLVLRNNDEVYTYQVEVSFEKKSNYKVLLTNKANNSTQVILKNSDGVYILTPALNRSFKFQSGWPYNNSQIYLLKSLANDINNDDKLKLESTDKYNVLITSVNYPNNKDLTSQKIILDKNLELKKVTVYDKDKVSVMEFKVKKCDYSPSFNEDYFALDNVMKTFSDNNNLVKETMTLEDTIYPLVLPTGTTLVSEEKIKKAGGERILMTFEGDSPFLLVEETANPEEEFTVIPTNGEPYQLMDTLGVMTENSLNWTSNGIEYYLVSDVLSSTDLVDIAQSIYNLPAMK